MNTNETSRSAEFESTPGAAITGSPAVDYSSMDPSVQHFGLREAEEQQHAGSSASLPSSQAARSGSSKSGFNLREELANIKSDLDTLLSRATSLSQQEMNSARDTLMSKFSSVQESAKDMASTAQGSAKDLASTAKEKAARVQESARGLASNASRMASDTRHQIDHGVDATTQYVRAKPLQAIGIAAGVGFLLASLLRRD